MRQLNRSLDDYLALAEPNEEGCRIWPMARNGRGYGVAGDQGRGKSRLVHDVIYGMMREPLVPGLQVGHTCHDRAVENGTCDGGDACRHRPCFEPSHLAAQTPSENIRLSVGNGNGQKADCGVCGRPLSGDNLVTSALPKRKCRHCTNRRSRESRERRLLDPSKAARIHQQNVEAGRRFRERGTSAR